MQDVHHCLAILKHEKFQRNFQTCIIDNQCTENRKEYKQVTNNYKKYEKKLRMAVFFTCGSSCF